MILRNKNKFLMYKTLNHFNKCNNIKKTQEYITKKYKLEESYFTYIISQCVDNKLIDGINYSKSISNHHYAIYSQNIYVTYGGYEFLKNYYGFVKRLIGNILLIVFTAIITVVIDNHLSKNNQTNNNQLNQHPINLYNNK